MCTLYLLKIDKLVIINDHAKFPLCAGVVVKAASALYRQLAAAKPTH